ncbi:MAG: transcriptional regulator [bacterium]|nr:transcriptional regulator [bacterium]
MMQQNLELLKRIAGGIVSVFGKRCEVVIHDFSDITRSVVHIEGNVTNRSVGAPVTGTMMRMLEEFGDQVPDKTAYKITTEDGKVLRCATIFLRNESGELEGCLAINFNISDFMFFSQAFSDFTFLSTGAGSGTNGESLVHFSKKPTKSMESIIDAAVSRHAKPPAMMNKAEKKEIVGKLEKAGVFSVKGSIDYLAKVFGASKYTVYNYLKEVRLN